MSYFLKKGFLPLFIFMFLSSSSLIADVLYVLGDKTILIEKTGMKIIEISTELKTKTGVSVYVSALDSLEGMSLKEYEEKSTAGLKAPFVWLYFIKDIKKINIIQSKELDGKIDKNSVFWDYIMPLVPKNDLELTNERVSAAILNGYIQIVEDITDAYKVELVSGIKSQETWIAGAIKYLFYFMIISLVALLAVGYIKGRKQ